jgi:hypothetical protein
MRSIRTAVALAATALLAVAFAVPAVASASNWKENGTEISGAAWTKEGATLGGSGGSLGLTGTIAVGNATLGSVSCPMTANLALNPISNKGQLKEFNAPAGGCKLTGFLKTTCPEVTAMTIPSESVGVSATESGTIVSEEFSFFLETKGCMIEKWAFIGKLTATPNKSNAIESVTLSGKFTSYYYYEGEYRTGFGQVNVSGTPAASPSGKYGISNQRLIKVTGSIQRMSATQGVSCPLNGTISIGPGSSTAKLELSPSECGSGPSCYSSKFTPASPWTLTDTGSSLVASGVAWTGGGCIDSVSVGEVTMSLDKASGISTSGFSVENKTPFGWHKHDVGMSWSPAGVYGL